jgi:hypothetical protein
VTGSTPHPPPDFSGTPPTVQARGGRRRPRGPVRVAALVLGIGTLLTACSGSVGRTGDAETEEQSMQVAADLQEEFAQLPGAVGAFVSYQDNITLQAALRANVTVSTGTDFAATLDAIEQSVWLSDVDPLRSVKITVVDQAEPPAGETREYDLDDRAQVKLLTERWGERP